MDSNTSIEELKRRILDDSPGSVTSIMLEKEAEQWRKIFLGQLNELIDVLDKKNGLYEDEDRAIQEMLIFINMVLKRGSQNQLRPADQCAYFIVLKLLQGFQSSR